MEVAAPLRYISSISFAASPAVCALSTDGTSSKIPMSRILRLMQKNIEFIFSFIPFLTGNGINIRILPVATEIQSFERSAFIAELQFLSHFQTRRIIRRDPER